jgi:hypothetical protein
VRSAWTQTLPRGKLTAAVGVLEHEQQLSLDLVWAQIESPAISGVNGSEHREISDAAPGDELVNVGGHAARAFPQAMGRAGNRWLACPQGPQGPTTTASSKR